MAQTTIAQGVVMVLNLAVGVLASRLLGPAGRGEYVAVAVWLLLPALPAVAGLQNAMVFEVRRQPERCASVTITAFGLATVAYFLMVIPVWFIVPLLMRSYSPALIELAQLTLILSVVNAWIVISRQSLLAQQSVQAFNLFTIASSAVYLALVVALVAGWHLTPFTAIGAQIAGSFIVFTAWLPRVMRGWRLRGLRLRDEVRPLLQYSLRAGPADLGSVLAANADKLFLVVLITPAQLGIYAAAGAFARVFEILQIVVSSVLFADLAGRSTREAADLVGRTFRVLFWLLLVCCGLVTLVDAELLRLTFGPAFAGAVPTFRILLIDVFVRCLGAVVSQGYLAVGKPTPMSVAHTVALVVTAGIVMWLAPANGAVGAAAGLAAGSSVRLLMLLAWLPRAGLTAPSVIPRASDADWLLALLRRPARGPEQPGKTGGA